jgi:hypothetical protein
MSIENEIKSVADHIRHQSDLINQLRQASCIAVEASDRRWRRKHPELISGENDASSLLARIREEKERLAGEKARSGGTSRFRACGETRSRSRCRRVDVDEAGRMRHN